MTNGLEYATEFGTFTAFHKNDTVTFPESIPIFSMPGTVINSWPEGDEQTMGIFGQ